jgi:transcriptional regulator with XRE-family HTH domain
MTIGQRIRHYREQRNLTQQQLADMIGVSNSEISLLESDKRRLTLENLDKIIKALDVKFTDILPEYK